MPTLHPGTKEAALAQHIIAMSYYDRVTDPSRDQGRTRKARNELKKLVRRYPESSYAAKARNRIKITTDMLAAAEMKVARYYLEQYTYLAAINRYRIVITTYQTTARYRLMSAFAYYKAGLYEEAIQAAKRYTTLHPGTKEAAQMSTATQAAFLNIPSITALIQ